MIRKDGPAPGNEDTTEELAVAADSNIVGAAEAESAKVDEALLGIVRATFADEANEAAAQAMARMIQGAGIAVAVAGTLIGVDAFVKQRARDCNCNSSPVYHYTGFAEAVGIGLADFMFTTKAYPPDRPSGAYATDIAPSANMTQPQLAATIYFNPKRQARADVSWFVALCNDDQPLFAPLSANPREWVKQGDYPGEVPVKVIAIGINPMPLK